MSLRPRAIPGMSGIATILTVTPLADDTVSGCNESKAEMVDSKEKIRFDRGVPGARQHGQRS